MSQVFGALPSPSYPPGPTRIELVNFFLSEEVTRNVRIWQQKYSYFNVKQPGYKATKECVPEF